MDKYFVVADLKRDPARSESLPVPGGQVYAGRIKAIIEAETWQDAMERGKDLISGCLKKHIKPYQWSWMPVRDAEKAGDLSVYDKYPTATGLTYYRIKAGMTQQQLSDASGVNIRQIQRVENGESRAENLTAKNLLALADALNVGPRSLL